MIMKNSIILKYLVKKTKVSVGYYFMLELGILNQEEPLVRSRLNFEYFINSFPII